MRDTSLGLVVRKVSKKGKEKKKEVLLFKLGEKVRFSWEIV